MTPEQAVELRKPFGAESVGKLPRVTCRGCRDNKGVCGEHRRVRCQDCGNWISSAHIHLDYVGHAEITDRLLAVDPQWTWEPLAVGQDGLPQMGHGGLWIRLTVAGVTRLGFGSADGKTGPDAVKEMIGDALRNAAMRFGVGLDLWGAKYKGGEDGHHDSPGDPSVFDGFAEELRAAKSPAEIEAAGRNIRASVESGDLSKVDLDRLQAIGARRLAELRQAQQPATVTPATDSPPSRPSRREQQLAAMDAKVAQRKETAGATPTP